MIETDTYPYPPKTTEAEAYNIWFKTPTATYVVIDKNNIVGTYYIKPNQIGRGSHVCNVGYMVSKETRGKCVGRLMCEHSLKEAARLGFKAMQFK